MAIQYVFVKVVGASASVDQTMTDVIYDAGGTTTRGYYRCIDVGSVAGEKLTRSDMKSIFDYEKSIWGDATSRSTLLYWNSVQNCFVINLCGWASKNVSQTQTDGSVYTDGIFLRECDLKPSSFTSSTFNTFGSLIDSLGTTIKIVDKQQPNLDSDARGQVSNTIMARGLSITGSSVTDQNSNRIASHFFSSRGSAPFNNVIMFKNGQNLYANNTMNYFSSIAGLEVSKIKNNEVAVGSLFGRHFIAPTKTQFDPDTLTAIPSKEIVASITSSGSDRFSGAADAICIDSTNLSQMYTSIEGNSDTSITNMTYAENTGQADVFGLIPGGFSVNCSFWIPTLQGATATSKSDPSRTLRFSVCSNSYGGRIGIGAVQRDFAYTSGTENNFEEFNSDEKHRVCLFVKSSESPHSFKYSWASPLTLKFKYRNSSEMSTNATAIQTNLFSFVHNKIIGGSGDEWLQLDPTNIMKEFKLDYSSAGFENGSDRAEPARIRGDSIFVSVPQGEPWYNAKLGSAEDVDYVHGQSVSSDGSTASDSFSIGVTRSNSISVSAVYPTSG